MQTLDPAHIPDPGPGERVAEALARELNRLQLITDALPVLVAYIGRDRRYQFVNSNYAAYLGLPGDEIVGRHVRDLHGPEMRQQMAPHFARSLAGEAAATEARVRGPDGTARYLSATYVPDREVAGEVRGVFVLITDETEQRLAEQALRASEARFRQLAENHPDIIYRYRLVPTPGFEYVSPSVTQVVGYTPEEHYADPELGMSIVHPDDRHLLDTLRSAPAGSAEPVTLRWICKDGSVRWTEQRNVLVRDEHGNPVAIEGAARDVTERVRAEQDRAALLEAAEGERKRIEAIIDTSPVGIMVLEGVEERVVLVNSEFRRIVGFDIPVGALAGQVALERMTFLRPDGGPYEFEDVPTQRALRNGEATHAEEMVFAFSDGRRVPVLVNATPVYARDGRVVSAIAAIQDMTPIEDIERLRSEFLGMVTHELRTPLTTIKGSAATGLTSNRPLPPEEVRELFAIVDEQADRLREMVDSLLDMTRIEAGALSVTPETVDMREILEAARDGFRRSGHSVDVEIDIPDDLPEASADRLRILQVLANLLSNAAKFSPPSAPISISAEQAGDRIAIHVRDRGRGVPADKLSRLFKKFSQVHEAADRRGGTGLGLAICRGIVEAHGGRIWAQSAGEGQGTTISFSLHQAVNHAADPLGATASLEAFRRDDGRVRVLVIDDDLQLQHYLRRTLGEAGFRVATASAPDEALAYAVAEQPDVIILDLVLPGASGFDILTRIREFSGAPVIILTASDRGEHAVRALTLGADDYIRKPSSPTELLARVGAVLRRRAGPATEVRPPFRLDDLAIDFAARRVTVGDRAVALSATEYRLLYELATHAGQVLTHDQILRRVWGPAYAGEAELIRSFVRNVRRKLGDDARHPRYVLTERQVGYRMRRPPD